MALIDIFNAVNTNMTGVTGLNQYFGAEYIRQESSPPRIVWVPMREDFGPPVGQGGSGYTNPRPLWTRRAGCSLHIWNTDEAAVESLLQYLIQTIHAQLGPNDYFPKTGAWINADGEVLKFGAVYVLNIEFTVPVVRPSAVPAPVTQIPTTVVDTASDESVTFTLGAAR